MENVLKNGEGSESNYFSVSNSKLVIMSVCTFGLYEAYWFYKNWLHIYQQEKEHLESAISKPFFVYLNTFFWVFTSYIAFRHIQRQLNEEGLKIRLNAGFLALGYVFFYTVSRTPEPYWILSVFSFLPLIPANNATTQINLKLNKNFVQNSTIKSWNWLAVILGSVSILAYLANFVLEVPIKGG